MKPFSRRAFLASSVAAVASMSAPVMAIEPIKRTGKPAMKLSLAAYSLRKFFGIKPGEPQHLDMPGFLDYCASLELDGAELTSYFFAQPVTPAYLADLKRKAHILGLDISGGAIGNNFTLDPGPKLDDQVKLAKTWVDHYAALGAPVIRVFAGAPPKGVSDEEAIKRCVPLLEEVCEYAGNKGIMLAIENHDFTTQLPRLMQIIKAVKSPWFGVNFDSGNFHSQDPYADMEAIAPYSVNVQVKVEIKRAGQAKSEPSDLPRVVKMLRDAGYRGYVVLEYEAAEDPYQAIPKYIEQLRKLIG